MSNAKDFADCCNTAYAYGWEEGRAALRQINDPAIKSLRGALQRLLESPDDSVWRAQARHVLKITA